MPISCYFRDCKALLVTSLTRVSGAIASVQTFTFTFYICTPYKENVYFFVREQIARADRREDVHDVTYRSRTGFLPFWGRYPSGPQTFDPLKRE